MTGNCDTVKTLLRYPAQLRGGVNAASSTGFTPLHCVANLTRVKSMWEVIRFHNDLIGNRIEVAGKPILGESPVVNPPR